MDNALFRPATDLYAVALIVVAQTASALRHLTTKDSAVLIFPAPLSQTAVLALTVLKGRSVLLVLAVEETFV